MSTRKLVLDIETAPNLAYVWDLWAKDGITPDKLVEATEVICFAWKWVGEKGVGFVSFWEDGQEALRAKAHELLDEADVVIHYNGKNFDTPHLNRELVLGGYAPPSPYEQVDLFLTAKQRFKFASNKLSYISKALGVTAKGDAGGFNTWLGVLAGDPKAQDKMRRYNMRDVVVTEALYHRLLPWIVGHPNEALDGRLVCTSCGSDRLQSRGYRRTRTRVYKQYQCQGCGSWSRATRTDAKATSAALVGAAL